MSFFYLYVLTMLPLLMMIGAAQQKGDVRPQSLKLIYQVKIDVAEPSGLTVSPDGTSLWTVSDRKKRVYQLDLQGNVRKKLPKTHFDLEGITTAENVNELWIIGERKRMLIQIDTLGNEIRRIKIDLPGSKNQGLEGIAWNNKAKVFYLLNEKNPGVLIKLDRDFSIEKKYAIDAAADYSGLFYDAALDKFWITSDESRLLMLWSERFGVERAFSFDINKAEGVAVDARRKRIYIVSDAESTLFVFKLPDY